MGMRLEFTALLICGVWEMLMGERRATTLELSCEFGDEDRDRSALLLALWSWDFHRFEHAKRERAAKKNVIPVKNREVGRRVWILT
jgi:hypothetical protein